LSTLYLTMIIIRQKHMFQIRYLYWKRSVH